MLLQMNNTVGQDPCQMVASLDGYCLGARTFPQTKAQNRNTAHLLDIF
jgi:hypothetical protein